METLNEYIVYLQEKSNNLFDKLKTKINEDSSELIKIRCEEMAYLMNEISQELKCNI